MAEVSEPENNALVRLLRRDQEWIANAELAEALGLKNARGNKSVVGHWPAVIEELGEETKLMRPPGESWQRPRPIRVFSKRALVLVAMRARTPASEEFRSWIASLVAASPIAREPSRRR